MKPIAASCFSMVFLPENADVVVLRRYFPVKTGRKTTVGIGAINQEFSKQNVRLAESYIKNTLLSSTCKKRKETTTMVKNIYKRTLSVLMSVLIMIPAFTSVSFADESLSDNSTPLVNISENAQSDNKISLNGSIEWDDNNNSEKNRPDSVTVNLYENDVLIDSKTTTESDQWQFTFNVNTQKDADAVNDYRFEQQIPKGYSETSHEDPVLDSGTITCEGWEKYTPCNELVIPVSKLSGSIIVGKLTGKYADIPTAVVWTRQALSDDEHSQIDASIRDINGIGSPKNVEFYSGENVSITQYGISFHTSDGKVLMDKPDCWALLAGTEYTTKYSQINSGLLKNSITQMPLAPDDPPMVDEPLYPEDPPMPEEPPTDEPPTSGDSTTSDDPATPGDLGNPPSADDPSKQGDLGNTPSTDIPQNSEQPKPTIPGVITLASPSSGTGTPPASETSEVDSEAYDIPQTGDNNNIIAWGILATLSTLVGAALCIAKLKMQIYK